MTGLDFADATDQDLRGAAEHLKAQAARSAVMGFCMGGALTIAAARAHPRFRRRSLLLRHSAREFADPSRIKAPFQGHFANQDDWCTPARGQRAGSGDEGGGPSPKSTATMRRTRSANERSPAYDVACANQAWEQMTGFLERRL